VAALALYWLSCRRYRWGAIYAVVAASTVGGWLLFAALAPSLVPGSSYVADAVARPAGISLGSAILTRLWRNVRYAGDFYVATVPRVSGTRLDEAIGLPLAGVALVAGLVAFWRKWPASIVYLCAYGALLFVWPWTRLRFLTPLFPWLVAAVVIGGGQIAAAIRSNLRMPAAVVVATVLAVTGISGAAERIRERQRCGEAEPVPTTLCLSPQHDAWANFFTIVGHVRAGLPADAIFVTPGPATLFFFTDRLSVPLTDVLSRSPSDFVPFLASRGARYVILSDVVAFTEGKPRLGGAPLAVMVRDNCHQFRLEASANNSAYLFRLATPGEGPSTAACQAADAFIERFGSGWK
jgi:hypothetical protein